MEKSKAAQNFFKTFLTLMMMSVTCHCVSSCLRISGINQVSRDTAGGKADDLPSAEYNHFGDIGMSD